MTEEEFKELVLDFLIDAADWPLDERVRIYTWTREKLALFGDGSIAKMKITGEIKRKRAKAVKNTEIVIKK